MIVHVAVNGKYAGHILISDKLKPHAKSNQRSEKSGHHQDSYADW